MHFLIYKTVNTVTGEFYIGKHQTDRIDDGYLGSGLALRDAIKKYGKAAFSREILFSFSSQEEMNAKEKEIVTEEFIAQPNVYNLTVGGEGGPTFTGKKHTAATRLKMSLNKIGKHRDRSAIEKQRSTISGEGNHFFRKTHSQESRQKISDAHRGRVKPHTCRPIRVEDAYGIREFSSIKQYAESRGMKPQRISNFIAKRRSANPDYRFREGDGIDIINITQI